MADPYWSDVVFLSGFEGGSAVDESPLAQTITLSGGPAVTSAQAKYGSQSLSHPNTGNASVPANAAFVDGATPWTCEGWIRLTSLNHGNNGIFGQWDWYEAGKCSWNLSYFYDSGTPANSKFEFIYNTDGSGLNDATFFTSNTLLAVDTWYFVAVDYDGSALRVYLDGVTIGNDALVAAAFTAATSPFRMGSIYASGAIDDPMNGYFDEVRYTVGTARYANNTGFTAPTAAFERSTSYDPDELLTDGVEILDSFNPASLETLASGVTVDSDALGYYTRAASDDIGVSVSFLEGIRAKLSEASETVNLSEALVGSYGMVLLETVALALAQIANRNMQVTATDTPTIGETLLAGVPVALADGVNTSEALQVQLAVQILESLGITLTDIAAGVYRLGAVETVRVLDSLARFFGADLEDAVSVTFEQASVARSLHVLAETVNLTAAVAPQLVLRLIATDTVEIDALQALQAIYSQRVLDGVELSAAYLSPGGTFTVWAMNTRTGYVTEYDNFEFNSFASMGNKYIAASGSGLYELNGDTDAGADIIARLKSGYMQFGGTKLSRLKSAYIATRGGGDFVLKIETGDGEIYNYAVNSRDMRSSKVHMGKGQRARYFAFELTSTGQDFDLDTLEFVPVVVERRV